MKVVVWFATHIVLVAALIVGPGLAGCSNDASPAGSSNDGSPPDLARASEGDGLCAGKANDETTSGQPDQTGCPNTCSCLCYAGKCYQRACTDIGGCAEPPVYR